MDVKTLHVLELNKVLHRLARQTTTAIAREWAEALDVTSDPPAVALRQRETSETLKRLEKDSEPPLGGIHDLRPILSKAENGATLEPSELLKTTTTLERTKELKIFIESHKPSADICLGHATRIENHATICGQVRHCVGGDGELLDRASQKLASLRNRIVTLHAQLQTKANAFLSDPTIRRHIQDAILTMRDGRYCLAVKNGSRKEVPGIVHDRSASGLTLFIEPETIVEHGNALSSLESDEEVETSRILRELSEGIAINRIHIHKTMDAAACIDFAYAKARLSVAMKATEPLINTNGRTNLRHAKHPLLEPATAVPIDFQIGNEFDVLIITGPNTGGKTLALKTVGLLTLMTQCGLHIPAQSGSQVSIFQALFADIGDNQSIEQNLSTFSSHMSNIVRILKEATAGTLVLLDEIGAGTDPNEGGSLAKAILDTLQRYGAKVCCTTHSSELKTFAYERNRFENACVLFDQKTLRPTYELCIGATGGSNALIIARRLGLGQDVICKAQESLDAQGHRVDRLTQRMLRDRTKMGRDRAEAQRMREEAASHLNALENIQATAKEEAEALLEEARTRADQLVHNAERDVDRITNKMRKAKHATPDRENLRQELHALRKHVQPKSQLSNTQIPLGTTVFIPQVNASGRVIDEKADGEKLMVQVGGMKFWVPRGQVKCMEAKTDTTPNKDSLATIRIRKLMSVPDEIHLRGKTLDEALPMTEKFLDDALLASRPAVKIIHGKGSGTLRQAVHEYLENHTFVASFDLAAPDEGGYGVTLVTLMTGNDA